LWRAITSPTQPNDKYAVEEHIDEQQEVDIDHPLRHHGIHADDQQLQTKNEEQRSGHGEARGQSQVMYVRFVGVENALPVQQTHAGHAHKIENRHSQQGDHHRHAVRARRQHHRVVHRVFDSQVSQGVAQHQTPGVAHESLGASTLRAEDVEEEKGHHGSDQTERHEGVGFDAQLPKQGRETAQSKHGQTARQAVDTVDQVHRIHDEQA
jgi:hypothetical protein